MSTPVTPTRAQPPQSADAVARLAMPPAQHLALPTTPGLSIPGQTAAASPLPSPQQHNTGGAKSSPQQSPSNQGAAAAGAASTAAAASVAPSSASGLGPKSSSQGKTPVRKVGKYVLGKTLGQGTFGKVKFATDTETGRHVAIKMMDKAKIRANNMGEQIKKEISIMKLIRHPGVIQLIEVLASSTTIYIVLELVTGGELFDKIIEEGCFSEEEARDYFMQLIEGIAHCHSHSVIHRDLKPENLLLDSTGRLKISDFGLSALSNDMAGGELLHTTCLSADTLVAMADIEPGVDGVLPPRALPVSALCLGMRLVGTGVPVTITSISPVETTGVMYEVSHTDGTAYRVTADHLVTLRWCAGPYTDMQQPASHEEAPVIALRWWIWQDNKLREGKIERRCRLTTDPVPDHSANDEVRGLLWDEFRAEEAKPDSDAALALFAGDLIDVPVSVLDQGHGGSALWNILFADDTIRATAAEVELPLLESERAPIVSQADVAAAVAALPAGKVAEHLVAKEAAAAIQLLGLGAHRCVTPGDRVNLVIQLHNPLGNKHDSTRVTNGTRQAAAIDNLEGVFADLGMPVGEGSGVVIAATTLVAGETADIHSSLPAYSAVCDAQMLLILNVLGASTIVACSRHASFGWRGARHLPGVSNLVNRTSEDGAVNITTFDYDPVVVAADSGAPAHGRKVTVYHSLHPCASNKEAIEHSILRALGLPTNRAVHRPHRRVANVNKITKAGQKFRRFTVDGDNRFAMADATVTHNCGTPNYVAPELLLLQDKGYDGKAADIWSSGVILYVLLAGFLPFDETSMVELFRKIVKADFAYPAHLSPEAISLLTIILNPDPEKRATIDEIRDHAWYRGLTLEEAEAERAEEEAEWHRQQLQLRQEAAAAQASASPSPSNAGPNGAADETHEQQRLQLTLPDGSATLPIASPTSVDFSTFKRNSVAEPPPPAPTSSETAQAITFLADDKAKQAIRAGMTPQSGPSDESASPASHNMRVLSLEHVSRVSSLHGIGVSTPATPSGPMSSPKPHSHLGTGSLLIPGSFSPKNSPAHSGQHGGGGASTGPSSLVLGSTLLGNSKDISPAGGSMQRRAASRMASTATVSADDNDPLSLDEDELEIRGPIPLNAFDLINMVGGAAMGRMFQKGTDKKVRTFTQFTSSLPLESILAKLEDLLRSIPEETVFRVYPKQSMIKASRSTVRGKVFAISQIYMMTPKLFMVEWRKMKGDVFLFHDFFREVKRRFTGAPEDAPSPSGSPGAYGSDEEDDTPAGKPSKAAVAAAAALTKQQQAAQQRRTPPKK